MDRDFHRIRRLPPYLFAEVNEMKARARRYPTSRGVRQFLATAEAFAGEAGRHVAAAGR